MRHAIVGFLIFLLVGLAACQDDATRLQEHMTRGEDYVTEGRYEEAVIEFKSVLQIDPNDAKAHFGLAHAYFRVKKPREGFWELRETVRLDPANHDAKLEFSQLAILAGEKEEALRQSTSVVEADPSNVHAHLVRGQALDSLDRRDEALASYEQALTVAPESETAMRVVAKARSQREKYQEAEELYTKLTELYPNYENYIAKGRLMRKLGPERVDEHEAILKKALEAAEAEERTQGYIYLASFYYRLDRKDESFAEQAPGGPADREERRSAAGRTQGLPGHLVLSRAKRGLRGGARRGREGTRAGPRRQGGEASEGRGAPGARPEGRA